MSVEHWKDEPDDKDFPAGESYLSLLVGPEVAAKLVKALRKQAELVHFAAKDVLRASHLALLGPDNFEVAADLQKVKSNTMSRANRTTEPGTYCSSNHRY